MTTPDVPPAPSGLAARVATEKKAKGPKCGAKHEGLVCVRLKHLPDDHAHVGEAEGELIQWAD